MAPDDDAGTTGGPDATDDPLDGLPAVGTARRVLIAALDLFAEQGYPATSIRAIADAVGVRSATLYDHFPSKGHILAALVTLGHESLLVAIERAVADAGDDPVDQMAALVRAHVLAHARHPRLAIVTDAEMARLPDDLAAPARAARARGEALAWEVYVRGAEAGRFSVANPVAALAAIGAMGLRAPHWFVASVGYTAEDLAADDAEYALRILGAARDA